MRGPLKLPMILGPLWGPLGRPGRSRGARRSCRCRPRRSSPEGEATNATASTTTTTTIHNNTTTTTTTTTTNNHNNNDHNNNDNTRGVVTTETRGEISRSVQMMAELTTALDNSQYQPYLPFFPLYSPA